MFGKKSNIRKVAHKFRLYESKSKCRVVDSILFTMGKMWNFGLAAIKEHYKQTGKYLSSKKVYALMKIERDSNPYWQLIGTQSMQEIVQRLDASYQRFFQKVQKRPPKFKSSKRFTSIVFKQTSYKVQNNIITLLLGKGRAKKHKQFKFINSRNRDYQRKSCKEANFYNLRIKRDSQDRYWAIFTIVEPKQTYKTRKTRGAIGGDFGLKKYLTAFNGKDFPKVENPQFLKQDLQLLQQKSKVFSRKKKGSNNRKKALKELLKVHRNITNKRNDWQWNLAHKLCQRFKFIGIEDLNIQAMQRIWGRKISDLAHSEFINKLKHVARKYGTVIQEVDRFFASSKTCCNCGYRKAILSLKERIFDCSNCGKRMDRDKNAAVNILKEAVKLYSQ
ncbi:MAG: RNA-guided endonuclease InsQ/TnpB family protein [Chitinophagales bacterium]